MESVTFPRCKSEIGNLVLSTIHLHFGSVVQVLTNPGLVSILLAISWYFLWHQVSVLEKMMPCSSNLRRKLRMDLFEQVSFHKRLQKYP